MTSGAGEAGGKSAGSRDTWRRSRAGGGATRRQVGSCRTRRWLVDHTSGVRRAVGLLVGIGCRPLGVAAAVGVVLYFLGAVIAHLRVKDVKGTPGADVLLVVPAAEHRGSRIATAGRPRPSSSTAGCCWACAVRRGRPPARTSPGRGG
ncbi:DoxX family protein [Streptomyces sp. NPDC056061]|uniref:DoxX family protein n=1 Tax=Streptomyces sp. NPDC056061 TaxID=3345700 RepID=UPI0035D950BD